MIVMYMAIKHLPEICENLMAAGRKPDEPVAVVSNATWDKMDVLETTLAHAPKDVAEKGFEPPAIICVGHVVKMRQCLDWIGQMNGLAPRNLDPLNVRPDASSPKKDIA